MHLAIEYERRSRELRFLEDEEHVESVNLRDLQSPRKVMGFRVRYEERDGWEQTCAGIPDWRELNDPGFVDDCTDDQQGLFGEVAEHHESIVAVFLADRDLHQEPMTYQSLAGEGEVCRQARAHLNSRILGEGRTQSSPPGAKESSGELHVPGGFPERIGSATLFDFDNSGHPDRVFRYEMWSSYWRGTVLYVDFHHSKESEKKVSVEDVKQFPCQFDPEQSSSTECPGTAGGGSGAGVEVEFEGQEAVVFGDRTTRLVPFGHEGTTYLLLQGNSARTEYDAAVIRVRDRTKYDPVCLFRRMSEPTS